MSNKQGETVYGSGAQKQLKPRLSRFSESRLRIKFNLLKDEQIIMVNYIADDIFMVTSYGELLLTADGRLFEDGIDHGSGSKIHKSSAKAFQKDADKLQGGKND